MPHPLLVVIGLLIVLLLGLTLSEGIRGARGGVG